MFKLLTVSAALVLQQTAPAPPPPAAPPAATVFGLQAPGGGLRTQDDSPFLGVVLGTRNGNVVVDEVVAGSAAQAAGLLAGDVLAMAGGVRIEESDDLLAALAQTGVGGTLALVVQRGGQAQKLEAVLGTRSQPVADPRSTPQPASAPAVPSVPSVPAVPAVPPGPPPPAAPVQVNERPFLGVNLGAAEGGALVLGAIEESAAARAGILPGDRIVRFGDRPVESTEALIDAVGDARVGERVSLEVLRDGDRLDFFVELGGRPAQAAPPAAGLFQLSPVERQSEGEDDWQQWAENADEEEWDAWAEAFEDDVEAWAEDFEAQWEYEGDGRRHLDGGEWEAWAERFADDMGAWAESEQLEDVLESFEHEFEASMEHFAERMEDHAERLAEDLERRSRALGEDFEALLKSAPRAGGSGAAMLEREMAELAAALERTTRERDDALRRVRQLEGELSGVRSEVAELRSEVQSLRGVLEELRSDGR